MFSSSSFSVLLRVFVALLTPLRQGLIYQRPRPGLDGATGIWLYDFEPQSDNSNLDKGYPEPAKHCLQVIVLSVGIFGSYQLRLPRRSCYVCSKFIYSTILYFSDTLGLQCCTEKVESHPTVALHDMAGVSAPK
ncbi:hypothetical protein EI94DRAFT_379259 [Lactarius quietus]|nr:hypothetical protein EI94DRAFT_379259 [Lactarius quietus]